MSEVRKEYSSRAHRPVGDRLTAYRSLCGTSMYRVCILLWTLFGTRIGDAIHSKARAPFRPKYLQEQDTPEERVLSNYRIPRSPVQRGRDEERCNASATKKRHTLFTVYLRQRSKLPKCRERCLGEDTQLCHTGQSVSACQLRVLTGSNCLCIFTDNSVFTGKKTFSVFWCPLERLLYSRPQNGFPENAVPLLRSTTRDARTLL